MSRSRFLEIPGEIREAIYHEILRPANNTEDLINHYKKYNFDLRLFQTCKQIHNEAREVFRRDNIFVSIQTPWPEAQQHVAIDGYVPIVMTGDKAQRFKHEYLKVEIESGMLTNPNPNQPRRKFVILLDDLPLFTEMWKYSDLSHPGLNRHLRLTLTIQDPYQLEFEQRPVPKALQRKLLQPFGMLKSLHDVRVQGEHYESIEKAMRDEMAVPYPSVESCLAESTRLKNAGNEALNKQQYHEALRLYNKAWLPLCIVCDGRRRSIWGDAYFQKECRGGEFDGQDAMIVRFLLRVRLVSNTVMAYLKLEDYEEASFWGNRTIEMLPSGVDDVGWLSGFAGSPEVGKIYYRTAIALRELGAKAKARSYLEMATRYLPNDIIVAKDLAALKNPSYVG